MPSRARSNSAAHHRHRMTGAAHALGLVLFAGDQLAIIIGVLILGLALHALIVTWLYRDVKALGRPVVPWTATGALLLVPTLIAWWIVRPRPDPQRATAASRPPQGDAAMRRSAAPYSEPPRAATYEAPRPEWETATDDDETFQGAARAGDGRPAAGTQDGTLHCTWCGAAWRPLDDTGPTLSDCPSCGTEQRR